MVVADSEVRHNYPDTNRPSGQLEERTDDIDSRVWIKFDLSKLSATQIISAKLYATIDSQYIFGGFQRQLNYHSSLDDTWDEYTITWNNRPDTDPIISDYAIIPNQNAIQQYEFDLTLDARNAIVSDNVFSGEIRYDDERDRWNFNQLYPRHFELNESWRPYLMVTYETEPHSLEERVSLLEYYINLIVCQLIPKGLMKDVTCPIY